MMLWLWQSSLLLALISGLLLLAHPLLLKRFGARSCYLLWLALPVAVFLPLLPATNAAASLNSAVVDTLVITAGQVQQQLDISSALPGLRWLWLTGAVLMACWCIVSVILLKRQLRPSRQVKHGNLRYYISRTQQGPAIFGVLRPQLILPANFWQRFNRQQRSLILRHELRHWQRGDLHANWLAITLLCLFWFHPLLWLAYRRYRADQELACDADVLHHQPLSTQVCYANALLAAMQSVSTPSATFQPFCHHYGAKQSMKERLLQLNQQHGTSKTPLLFLLASLGIAALFWQQPVQADNTATTVKSSPTPIVRIEPRYPIQAAENRIEGLVQLQFNVQSDGSTSDIIVVHAQPEGVFEKEAVAALKRWRYAPMADPAANIGLKVQLNFALDYDPDLDIEQLDVRPKL
ncbi:TonB family protein [Arsukibacterium sp.]|uniref:M56 family metallopeptidase n=1 Tax=Arsukibacterium sp. TaxID=1977258 RepID=UPI001BD38141|nr:TonB family protein [Arsukibacterium sp.]